jgi:hypothetical protein
LEPALLFSKDELERFAKEGIRATPKELIELDAYINTLEHGSPFHYVLTAYRDKANGAKHSTSDRKVFEETATKVSNLIFKVIDKKQDTGNPLTDDENKAINFYGIALQSFSERQKHEHRS